MATWKCRFDLEPVIVNSKAFSDLAARSVMVTYSSLASSEHMERTHLMEAAGLKLGCVGSTMGL